VKKWCPANGADLHFELVLKVHAPKDVTRFGPLSQAGAGERVST
jgi:hypothetical protein